MTAPGIGSRMAVRGKARRERVHTGVVVGACLALIVSGCDDPAGSTGEDGAKVEPIVKTVERGPVKLTVSVDKNVISLAERLELTIEAEAADGVDVEMPQFGEQLDAFAIRDFRNFPAEPIEGGRRWRQTYDLDVFVSGEYPVPELTVRFVDRRDENNVIEGEITTDAFTVTVASLLEGEFDPTQFREVKGPVELPISRTWMWVWWVAGGTVAVGIAVWCVVWFIRWLRREQPEIQIPAHEWAYDELQKLLDEQLIEKGLVNEFYFRLSMIVRVYIERRFDLMAPEWTTQEFLIETQRSEVLPFEHRSTLGGFLQACDMVKFALHRPDDTEIEQAFDGARDFVSQTAESAPQGEQAVAA